MSFIPLGMNIELTTCCPLHCPQCYCSLEGGKHIPLDIAEKRIIEAGRIGVKAVNLSGGETLCYPWLFDVIRCVKEYCGTANIAISGWSFSEAILNQLIEVGVDGIHVSLNGSTPEINRMTRDGYQYAIKALSLLQKKEYPKTHINWVMHSSNADDFPNLVALAEKYNVKFLDILVVKPDSKHQLNTFPSKQQMFNVSEEIKHHRGNTTIAVETCFSQMLALTRNTRLFGNLNLGEFKGCGAGRWTYNVNVDGKYSPCRHIELFEQFDTAEEYWENSTVLARLRNVEKDKRFPCNQCELNNNCRHCLAINYKIHNEFYLGHDCCELFMMK